MRKLKQKPVISNNEAEKLVCNINKKSPGIFKNVVLMVVNEASMQLEFPTAKQCLRVYKPDLSASYISLLLSAADIYCKVDSNLFYLDKVSESLFRPLREATDEYALEVWNLMLQTFDHNRKRIKATDIVRAIDQLAVIVETNKECQFIVDDKTLCSIQRCAKKISKDKLFANFKTQSEWQNVAALIFQNMLMDCPHGEMQFESAPIINGEM